MRTLIAGTSGLIGLALVSFPESAWYNVILSSFLAVAGPLGADIKRPSNPVLVSA